MRCIVIDALGKKWIGTDYGLSVYDDISWTNYFTTNSGLPDNVVRAVAFDSLQNAWIGTFNGGVAKFDGINWTVYDITNSMLPDNSIKSLAFDSAGALWIGTISGLAKFDGSNWLTFTSANSLLTYDNIAAVLPVENKRVFVGTVNGGLAVVDNDTIKDVYTIANGSGIPDNTQVGFDEDSSGNVWIATPSNGIVVRRIVGGWFWYYLGNSFIPSNALSALKFTSDESALWFSTLDSGIVKRTGINYQSYNMTNSPMPDNTVQCITLDSNNVVWAGTASQGVIKFDETILGIATIHTLAEVVLYPNPAHDFLHITCGQSLHQYKIFDSQGRILTAGLTTDKDFRVDVSSLSKGVYFLQLQVAGGNILSEKFIK